MFQLCFFVSIAYSFCVQPQPVEEPLPIYTEIVQHATEFIAQYEGLSLKAYPDTLGWSIGYGTRSYAGEVITQQEAFKRMEAVVNMGVSRVVRDFPELDENGIIAMTSIYYNCWKGYLRAKNEWLFVIMEPWFCRVKWYPGLEKRRIAEQQLLWSGE